MSEAEETVDAYKEGQTLTSRGAKTCQITRMEAKMAQRSTTTAGSRKTKMNFISPGLASLLFCIICSQAPKASMNDLARMSGARARLDIGPSYTPPLAPPYRKEKKREVDMLSQPRLPQRPFPQLPVQWLAPPPTRTGSVCPQPHRPSSTSAQC